MIFLLGNDLFGHSDHISKYTESIYFYVLSLCVCMCVCVCVYVLLFILKKPFLVSGVRKKRKKKEEEEEMKLRTILSEAYKQFS